MLQYPQESIVETHKRVAAGFAAIHRNDTPEGRILAAEARIADSHAKLLLNLRRIVFWQGLAYLALFVVFCAVTSSLTACGGEGSPPDDMKTIDPVTCAASAACG